MDESGRGPTSDAAIPARPSRLSRLKLEGYKSFRDEGIDFGDVTVLLGANGAGKSNLVSFFGMLGFLSAGALQEYIGRAGHSDSILFGGRKTTPQLRAEIEFVGGGVSDARKSTYRMRLGDAAPDTLIFLDESARNRRSELPQRQDIMLGAGHRESRLKQEADKGQATCRVLLQLLSGCRAYHFHDTSPRANIRRNHYIEDARYLRHDAANLGACLYALKNTRPDCYWRIVETVRLVFPAFGDFSLAPSATNTRAILLNWYEKDRSDHLCGPHQLSDGSLRFMALATLLLQPPERLPNVMVLDEPELGLHPCAISVLAAMVRSAATRAQVVLATQSSRLVDEFKPHQVLVLETRGASGTKCHRLSPSDLAEWLQEYSLGELWEKNRFGGALDGAGYCSGGRSDRRDVRPSFARTHARCAGRRHLGDHVRPEAKSRWSTGLGEGLTGTPAPCKGRHWPPGDNDVRLLRTASRLAGTGRGCRSVIRGEGGCAGTGYAAQGHGCPGRRPRSKPIHSLRADARIRGTAVLGAEDPGQGPCPRCPSETDHPRAAARHRRLRNTGRD